MPQISECRRDYRNSGGGGTTNVTVTIPPFSDGEIDIDTADLSAGEIKVLPAGGLNVSVANQGVQGTVTVNYGGAIIPLMPGQHWTEGHEELSSTQTTYLLKAITITVSADGEGTYTFRSPE